MNLAWKIKMEKEGFKKWQSQQNKFILFFNGASKGNLGVTGVMGNGEGCFTTQRKK
jgi:hypothetical protein